MLRYDLHIHTKYSLCSNLEPKTILKLAQKLKLNGLAITDHNTLKGALLTKKLNRHRNLKIIPGEEITTPQGHILVYYLTQEIRPQNLFEVIDQARQQGALIGIAHPYGYLRAHFRADLKQIKNKIDFIETINSRNFSFEDCLAKKLAQHFHLPQTAGSDAHFPFEINSALTLFPDSHNLRKALKNKKTTLIFKKRHPSISPPLSKALKTYRQLKELFEK